MKQQLKRIIKKIIPSKYISRIKTVRENRSIRKLAEQEILPFEREKYPKGINLIGPIRHDTGLGQSCRLLAHEIDAAQIPYGIRYYSSSSAISSQNKSFDKKISDRAEYGINIIHINMHEFANGLDCIGKETLDCRYNIAFWLWEMEEFPQQWVPFTKMLDEIWTPSEFTSNSVRGITDKKVYTIPYAVEAKTNRNIGRKDFGLPEDLFLFLMLFDNNSIAERKNPYGVLHAFKTAFDAGNQEVGLIIKINNASESLLNEIKFIMKGYRIFFIKETLPKTEVNRLIELSDVYVSLHRAEGFGLVLAEAMILGTPTIATNYSSNTEFQDKESACLVNYKKVPVGRDIYPYEERNLWADPDIEEASRYMRRLYEDGEYYQTIQENARIYIRSKLNMDRISEMIRQRVDDIYKK